MYMIIDIDEDDYKLIKDGGNIPSNLRDLITSSLFYRIRNGIPVKLDDITKDALDKLINDKGD